MAATDDREIERKFLLRELPAGVRAYPCWEIDQGYLPGERITERVRRMRRGDETRYVRTCKLGRGLERLEFEEDTTEAFFAAVWPLTRGQRVHKRRYLVPFGGRTWEVDEFLDRPLVFAEIELRNADDAPPMPPAVAAVLVREVTDEPEYTNHALAR